MAIAAATTLVANAGAHAQSCGQVAAAQAHIAEQRDGGVPLATVYRQIEQSFPDSANLPESLRGLRTRYIEERETLAAGIYRSGKSAADVRDQAMRACEDLKAIAPPQH